MPRHSDNTKVAIKNAVDIVALVGEYLPLRRAGSKFKALCPFHDDHNPSLEVNPERQSYKCWSCSAGGDVFDFVKNFEHVDFPEAMRMLAERAGIVLESPPVSASVSVATAAEPSRSELLEVNAWAEELFARLLTKTEAARAYALDRGLTATSIEQFRLGYAPIERGWLVSEGRSRGYSTQLLEQAGLVSRPEDSPGTVRERFRGRLIFPIHDERGRAIGFGGRILPEVERAMALQGKNVAKYLNSPETALFQKRKVLYAADRARAACREAKWVAVVEGYTDVIVAHQVGLGNVVGTLGTALGEDHVRWLKRLAELVVLVFDGDTAGQNAADRALEFFLGNDVDVRILSLPANLDPCDFLLKEGADSFRELVAGAVDPLAFVLERAEDRFDISAIEGSRQATEWVLGILSRIRLTQRIGLDLKLAKCLDNLSVHLNQPVERLKRRLSELRHAASRGPSRGNPGLASVPSAPRTDTQTESRGAGNTPPPIRLLDLDPLDLELVQIVLNEPGLVSEVISRVTASSLRDAPLRAILQACYDLHGEGQSPSIAEVMHRLDDPQFRDLVAGFLLPLDPEPMPENMRPASWQERLKLSLGTLAERERQHRIGDLRRALAETDESTEPDAFRALQLEYRRLMNQRPDTK